MMTPRDRYMTDTMFKTMVDTMIGVIHRCQMTPSELREAALLASIIYEEQQISHKHCIEETTAHLEVINALQTAWDWACKPRRILGEQNVK